MHHYDGPPNWKYIFIYFLCWVLLLQCIYPVYVCLSVCKSFPLYVCISVSLSLCPVVRFAAIQMCLYLFSGFPLCGIFVYRLDGYLYIQKYIQFCVMWSDKNLFCNIDAYYIATKKYEQSSSSHLCTNVYNIFGEWMLLGRSCVPTELLGDKLAFNRSLLAC